MMASPQWFLWQNQCERNFQRLGIKCYIIDDDDIKVKISCTQQQQFNFLQGRTVFMGYSFGGDPEDPVNRTSLDNPSYFLPIDFANLSSKIFFFSRSWIGYSFPPSLRQGVLKTWHRCWLWLQRRWCELIFFQFVVLVEKLKEFSPNPLFSTLFRCIRNVSGRVLPSSKPQCCQPTPAWKDHPPYKHKSTLE